MEAVSQKCGFGEASLGSHCVRLIHTNLLKGCVALQYIYFASYGFQKLITPSGSRISEMRLRRGFARVSLCSPDPYASFERMCGPPIYIFCELCLPLTVHLVEAVSQKCGFGEASLGSHCVRLIHTHLLKGCVALQYVYFASNAFH